MGNHTDKAFLLQRKKAFHANLEQVDLPLLNLRLRSTCFSDPTRAKIIQIRGDG
jgi:hypothetical protein